MPQGVFFSAYYLLEGRNHDIWPIVDSQDDIRHTSSGQALDLMEDHRTVGKLDQWLGESESLSSSQLLLALS